MLIVDFVGVVHGFRCLKACEFGRFLQVAKFLLKSE